ncbi:RHS repeat-associated core domain-containing protein [Chryseobacterium sp. PET-29]|uniref:RHS repeat domain-containing protein n=1 Tax=Chryseobacterium sp. PET-29 TaxID=2983267 RepID=UPI002965EC7A|nr:RHS repeat-associated core domain-containing protein [Chryseobacterium sp. PET-29]
MSYFNNGSGIEVLEENNYYPFGLKHEGYNALDGNSAYQYKYQGQELQETGFYSFKWRNYMPDVGRFFNIDPLAEKFPYNSTYAFQENKLGMGVELEGLELLKNHTGFFAIHGNAMRVVRAPGSQISNGRATFTAADIGLTTQGYNPGAARMSDGSSGLKLKSYAYSGPNPNGATMENVTEMPSNLEAQKFTTTKRGLEMTNKLIKNYDKLNTAAGGAQELVGLLDLAANVPDAIKSTKAYVQAAKDVKAIDFQATQMDLAIDLVNSSGIDMTTQTRNDVINFVFDGTVPNPGAGLMPNSLIISKGTQILKNNNLPVQPLDEQINTNKKVLP